VAGNVLALSFDHSVEGRGTDDDADRTGPTDFLVGPENASVRYAHRALCQWFTSPDLRDNNPLIFCGAHGTGKSHLAQGLATQWSRRRPNDPVVIMTGADFVRACARAARSDDLQRQRMRLLNASLCVIDDVHQLTARNLAQCELATICDHRLRHQRPLILTAPKVPSELAGMLPRLSSRLLVGLCVVLKRPGRETRRCVIERVARDQQVALPDDAVEQLSRSIPSGTVADIRARAMRHIALPPDMGDDPARDAAATKQQLPLTDAAPRILQLTAKAFNVRVADLTGKSRRRSVATPRALAMFLMRRHTNASFQAIGRKFGGRDHTTVGHACRQAEKRLREDAVLRRLCSRVETELPRPSPPACTGPSVIRSPGVLRRMGPDPPTGFGNTHA
jgi:chromosomal replication initiator protein